MDAEKKSRNKEKGVTPRRSFCCNCRCYVFSTFVTEGRVGWNLRFTVWTRFESEALRSNVLVHALG